MAIKVSAPVTIFKESKALRINKKIKPKDRAEDERIFLSRVLKVSISAKYKDAKKAII